MVIDGGRWAVGSMMRHGYYLKCYNGVVLGVCLGIGWI